MYNLTNRQAKEFLQTVIKHLNVFKNDAEFGWGIERQDLRQHFVIRNYKYDTINSVQSFPCASKASDANIGLLFLSLFLFHLLSLTISITSLILYTQMQWYGGKAEKRVLYTHTHTE